MRLFLSALLFLSSSAEAGLLDFLFINQANTAYQNKEFQIAGEKFSNIDHDTARFNYANSLYKQNLYQQALEKYQSIKQETLTFERLYNSGNAYANMGKINEAISSYEAALKIKQDKDALFNLVLLKKQKTQRKNNEQAKKDKHQDPNNSGVKKEQQKSSQRNSQGKKGKEKQQLEKLGAIKKQRWDKSLKRKLRTLLIPLNEQQNSNNEKNPW